MIPIPPVSQVQWAPAHRIVSSRFPPVGLFDEIADPADLEALYEIDGLTNPRLRQEMGMIRLVPAGRRVAGPGTTPIMAAFTHPNPEGSRFSPGAFGVYYAAFQRETAIQETVHHRTRFLAMTREVPCRIEMRAYVGDIAAPLYDIRGGWPALHDPSSYVASQRSAVQWRNQGSDGILYDSVRHPGGLCVALFYPDLAAPVQQAAHLSYHWDGTRITHVAVAEDILVL